MHKLRSTSSPIITPKVGRPSGWFIALPLGMIAVLLPWLIQIDSSLQIFLATALVTLCSIGIVLSCYHGLRPVALIFYSFTLTWIGLGATYQLAHDSFAWDDYALATQQGLLTSALLLLLAATTAFFLANTYFHGRPSRIKRSATFSSRPLIIWGSIAGAVLLAPFSIRASGGIANMFASRSERSMALVEAGVGAAAGNAQLGLLKTLPAALAIAACYLAVKQARDLWSRSRAAGHAGISRQAALAVLVSFMLICVFCNPFSNTRFLSVLAFGSVLLAAYQPRTPRAAGFIAAGALIGTSIVYPLANIFRREKGSAIGYKTGADAFASADFDGFQQVANALVFVEDTGHSFGQYMSSALFYFVPRSIWSEKAAPASLGVAENRGYYFTNLSLPFPAELYVEWGIAGVLIGMALLGLLAAKADSDWLLNARSRLGTIAPIMALVMLGFIRGPLGSLAPLYLTALGVILLGLRKETGTAAPSLSRPPAFGEG